MDENKKVSTEDMEQVAGGTDHQTADDSRFLNVLLRGRPGQCNRYGENTVRYLNYDKEIAKAWASVGVTCKIDSGGWLSGGYSISKKRISS